MCRVTARVLATVPGTWSMPAPVPCEAWTSYNAVALRRFPGDAAYAYRTGRIAIDADGAPNAYQPQDRGFNALANAGFPNGGWRSVLVADPNDPSRPFVQEAGEFAGFFLSMTSLQDHARRYGPRPLHRRARRALRLRFFAVKGTGRLGALGMARNLSSGQTSPMVFADVGGHDDDLGEISIKLAENLGGHDVNPRNGHGALRGPFVYVVFPGTEADPPGRSPPIGCGGGRERGWNGSVAGTPCWPAWEGPDAGACHRRLRIAALAARGRRGSCTCRVKCTVRCRHPARHSLHL